MFPRIITLAGSVAAVFAIALPGAAQAEAYKPNSKAAARQINSALRWDAAILKAPSIDRAYATFDMADQARRARALSKTVKSAKARLIFASVAKQVRATETEAQFGDREKAASIIERIAARLVPLFAA